MPGSDGGNRIIEGLGDDKRKSRVGRDWFFADLDGLDDDDDKVKDKKNNELIDPVFDLP